MRATRIKIAVCAALLVALALGASPARSEPALNCDGPYDPVCLALAVACLAADKTHDKYPNLQPIYCEFA